jgi:S1-C subfamily serine protease
METDRVRIRVLSRVSAFILISSLAVAGCAARQPMAIPRHLLHSPCAHAKDVPGDKTADPILFAGCDDAERSAFIRRNIAATVVIFVGRYSEKDQALKYAAGTGTIIDEEGTVLTAFHVIEDAEFVTVTLQQLSDNGQSVKHLRDVPMRVSAVSPDTDTALLRPSHVTAMPKPMPLCRHDQPKNGDLLWHFGRTTTWAAGKVTATDVTANGVSVIEVDVRVNFGDSGGPLVNASGQLVGVTLSMHDKATMYFVHVDRALKALGYKGTQDACPE